MQSASKISLESPIADRYRSELLLGRGGMGSVHAVYDPVTERRVALKLLEPDAKPAALALFEREYRTLASLKHPRIVEVYEFGRAREGTYYTMELLEGSDLSARAPMPWREVCASLRDAASVLQLLCQHLVRKGAAYYSDGSWILPSELASAELPSSRAEGILNRLDQLSDHARALGRRLAVPHHGPLDEALCVAAAGQSRDQVLRWLSELTKCTVLRQTSAGYTFAHETLREALHAELPVEQRAAVHLRLAEAILDSSSQEVFAQVLAGLHLLRAGDIERGARLQGDAAQTLVERVDAIAMRSAGPLLEQGYELIAAAGKPDHACDRLLAALASAGYLADRRYSVRYGPLCLEAHERLLKTQLARKLAPWLGGKLALIIALTWAFVCLPARERSGARLSCIVRNFLSAASSVMGTNSVCLDGAGVSRVVRAIEPLGALGADHVAGAVVRYNQLMSWISTDHFDVCLQSLRTCVHDLESPRPIRGMLEPVRQQLLAGALYALGIRAAYRDGAEALEIAARLESLGPLAKMQAHTVRGLYFGNQGNTAEAALHQRAVDGHSLLLGSAWQAELYGPAERLKIGFWTHDRLMLKRATHELARLSEEVPSFSTYARCAQGYYELACGKPQLALRLLDQHDDPQKTIGWTRSRGAVARALNALGQPEQARAVCLDALRRLTPGDLEFPSMTLVVPLELAVAEAALGNHEEARQLLRRTVAQNEAKEGPLTMGAIEDAWVQVELIAKDYAACDAHLEAMSKWYARTGSSSVSQRVELLRRSVSKAQRREHLGDDDLMLSTDDVHLITRVQLMLTHTGNLLTERASRGLQICVELSGADCGFLVVQGDDGIAAWLGEEPSAELVEWALQRLMVAYAKDETAAVEDVGSLIDLNLKMERGTSYCVAPLWARRERQDVVVAALALGFSRGSAKLPPANVLSVLADFLIMNREPSTSDIASRLAVIAAKTNQ